MKQNTSCIKSLNLPHGYKHMHIQLCTTLQIKLDKAIQVTVIWLRFKDITDVVQWLAYSQI